MSNNIFAFLKRLTTDQDFKTLVQNDPDTAFSQFSLSPAEQATLSEYAENPDDFRKSLNPQSSGPNFWY